MGQVQGIRKGDRNAQQGFNFRGIDAVMNHVGPALREHGVVIIPEAVDMESERYDTAKGGKMKNVTVLMKYTVHGPEGDSFSGSAYGEAADAGDKAVSKAQSVAYRTFLLQSLTVPTDEPDPDSFVHERAEECSEAELAINNVLSSANRQSIPASKLRDFLDREGVKVKLAEVTDLDLLAEMQKWVDDGAPDRA